MEKQESSLSLEFKFLWKNNQCIYTSIQTKNMQNIFKF